jgi:capsular polysaccharide biosynthesis protein
VISPTVHAVDTAPSDGRGSWLARWPWARRRSWLLLVGLLAGTLGGVFAATHGRVSYSATAVLEVAGPSSTTALSNAQGATQLAVTYAALIPSDEALLRLVARELGTQPSVLARELAVQAESGTALVEVRLSATSPIEAVAGANDVARALGSGRVPGQAIAPGSMTLVSAARTASPSGTLHKYGIALGVLLGLVVGVGAVIVAERTDRRIDDVESLADAAGCRATRLPGGIPVGELARGLARAGIDAVSVLAILPHDRARASELAHGLAAQRGVGDAALLSRVDTGEPLAAANVLSPDTEGPTLLVVTRGERVSAVEDTASRLRRIGRDPVAAVLLYPLGSRARRGAGRPDPVAP